MYLQSLMFPQIYSVCSREWEEKKINVYLMTLSRLEHEMCIIGGEMKFQNEKEIRRID